MSLKEKRSKKIDTLIALLGTIAAGVFIAFFFDYYYDMNDDVVMKDILSGAFSGTPSGYNIQMLFPLSYVISLFYRVNSTIPWYGLFLCGCNVLCVFLISKRMIEVTHKYWKKLLFFAGYFFLIITLYLWDLVFVQYTVTCAMMMATAAYWFYTTDYTMDATRFLKQNIISIVLVLTAFCLRSEMALLLSPMICAVGIFRWIDAVRAADASEKVIDGKKNTKFNRIFAQENRIKYLSLILIVAIGMFLMLLIDKMAYNGKDWRDFISLFHSRTEIYDFLGIPEYEGNKEIYETVGLSREQQVLLENYNYIVDNSINTEMLDRMETVLSDGGKTFFTISLGDGIRSYLYRMTHKVDAPYIYYVWLGYFIMLISSVMLKKRSYLWKLPFLFLVRSALWMYLIMRNRLPDRITHGMYAMELLILMAMILSEIKCFKSSDKALYRRFWPITVLSVSTIVGIGASTQMLHSVYEEQVRRGVQNSEWIELQNYCMENPQNLYLLDVYSTVAYSEKMFEDVDNSFKNYNLAGGWICKSPLEAEKLAQFGVTDVEHDLVNYSNIFFVAYSEKEVDWLSTFYESKGIHVHLKLEGCIQPYTNNNFTVYSIRKNSYKKFVMINHLLLNEFGNQTTEEKEGE